MACLRRPLFTSTCFYPIQRDHPGIFGIFRIA